MRYVLGCLCSAVLGSLFTVWLIDVHAGSHARAQDADAPAGPEFEAPFEDDAPDDPPPPARGPRLAPKNVPNSADADEAPFPDEAVNVAVYERNNRSVVNITTRTTNGFLLLDVASEGTGSGSIIDKKGHILTIFHVVDGAQEVTVTLFDGSTHVATLVGADPRNDIAVLKIDVPPEKTLIPVALGDSSNLKVGMKVYAIGNPFGLERTMSMGIISSLNRSLQIHGDWTIKSIIQIDAAVNPGNSGGPLLDSRGRLIGINTAIATATNQSAGVGFAIPINLAKRVVPQLIQHGRVIRPEIGIQRVYVTDVGLQIEQLTPGGPAEQAGLRGPYIARSRRGPFVVERLDRSAADVIDEVDGEEVKTGDDLLEHIERKKAGDTIELTVIRQGKRLKIPLTLGSGEGPVRRRIPQ